MPSSSRRTTTNLPVTTTTTEQENDLSSSSSSLDDDDSSNLLLHPPLSTCIEVDDETDSRPIEDENNSASTRAFVLLVPEDDTNDTPTRRQRQRQCFCGCCCTTACCCRYVRHCLGSCTSWFYQSWHSSLAMAQSTPKCATLLVPLITILAHGLFYYGQTADMWRLVYMANIDVEMKATSLEAKTVFWSLGIDEDQFITYHQDANVRTFTYGFAIHELWAAAGMPSVVLPRIAAILLVVFSGIWPHLKLFLLFLTWCLMSHVHQRKRSRLLHVLSTLGKWSLADVLVVCIMIGVLQIDWIVDPTLIKQGFVDELPLLLSLVQTIWTTNDVCSFLLHQTCTDDSSYFSKCTSCRNFVNSAFAHPQTTQSTFRGITNGVQESGGGSVSLRVQGMNGIYSFCAAVILSILLSLLVDVYDLRAKRSHQSMNAEQSAISTAANDASGYQRLAEEEEEVTVDQSLVVLEESNDEEEGVSLPLTVLDRPSVAEATSLAVVEDPSPRNLRRRPSCWYRCCLLLTTLPTAVLVFIATFDDTLLRRVTGAGPELLHNVLGIAWDRSFSMWTLAQTTGDAGGYDNLLMGTFALFLVVGPCVRAVFVVLAVLWSNPTSKLWRRLTTWIDVLGAFCAWEVIVVAAYMVSLLIPSTTATIIERPECRQVSDDGSCLEVFFDPQSKFGFIIVGGILLVTVSQFTFRMMKRH